MREHGKFLLNLTLVSIASVVSFRLALYIHEDQRAWEAPGCYASLLVAAAVLFWYLRFRRHGWLVASALGLTLSGSLYLAIYQGWGSGISADAVFGVLAIVLTAITIALTVMVVAVLVIARRITSRQADALRAIREAVRGTALFHDDGERITVYPNGVQVLPRLLVMLAFVALSAVLYHFIPTTDARGMTLHVISPIACLYGCIFALALLFRVVVRRPSLIVGPNGIFDGASLIATGVGQLGWDEIWKVTPGRSSSGRFAQGTLRIMVLDARAVRRRLPVLKRFACAIIAPGALSFTIWQDLEHLTKRVIDWRHEQTSGQRCLVGGGRAAAAP